MKHRILVFGKDEKAARERDAAIAYLKENNIRYTTPHPHQIKIGPISFYPSTGTITEDGRGRREEQGAEGLIELLDGYASSRKPGRRR